jgi:hypothetical protein
MSERHFLEAMLTKATPRPPPDRRSLEEEIRQRTAQAELDILEAIRSGDLAKIKSIKINPRGIDSRLGINADTIVYPSCSKEIHIEKLNGPTCLIYSILCERPEFVDFFLTNFSPDMSSTINGWTPFHFACVTRDISCLRLLLQHQYVQENVNVGIDSTDVKHTTAIHLAVQHGLHSTVLALTQPFPPIRYPRPGPARENRIQLSILNAVGQSPLHLAVNRNDWDMIQILVGSRADLSLTNTDGQSAFDLAKAQSKTNLVQLFENAEFEVRPLLERKYLGGPQSERAKEFFDTVFARLQMIRTKLGLIEEELKDDSEKICSVCEKTAGALCGECNQYLCLACWTEEMHRCGTEYPK